MKYIPLEQALKAAKISPEALNFIPTREITEGYWISKKNKYNICSVCQAEFFSLENFCGHCGADMRKGEIKYE